MKYSRTAHHLYTASLFILIFLTGVCVAISAVDVIIQAFFDRTEIGHFNYSSVIVVAAGYIVLVNKTKKIITVILLLFQKLIYIYIYMIGNCIIITCLL